MQFNLHLLFGSALLAFSVKAQNRTNSTTSPSNNATNSSTSPSNSNSDSPLLNGCIKLDGSSIAPEFNQYSVISNFNDTKTFDEYVLNRRDDNPNYINTFRTFFNCPNWDGYSQRFHLSYFASFIVYSSAQSSASCPQPSNAIILCRETCQIARSALAAIFNDPKQCTSLPFNSTGNRESTINSYDIFCRNLKIANTQEGACIPGLGVELKSCGFPHPKNAEVYCATNGTDPCCSTLGQPVNFLNTAPTANKDKSLIIGLSVGGAFLVVAAGAFMYWYFRYRMVHQNSSRSDNDFRSIQPSKRLSSVSSSMYINDQYDMHKNLSGSNGSNGSAAIMGSNSMIMSDAMNGFPSIKKGAKKNQETKKVIHTYVPMLADECPLNIGDIVILEKKYDDGWGVGKNKTTGHSGAFPLACLAELSAPSNIQANDGSGQENRDSSLPRNVGSGSFAAFWKRS